MNAFNAFFSSAGFLPHGYCILWRPDILTLHAVSDLIIAVSYFSIPLAIIHFIRRRADLVAEHKLIALLFSVFILGCGLTHVFGIIVLWRPVYVLDGVVKAGTAIASIFTAFVLWPVLPRLLEIPSPRQLALANDALQAEIAAKQSALAELETIRSNLEGEVRRRTAEVQALARRFEIATADSVITVSEQDAELRYTWLHNPRPPLSEAVLGQTDEEALEGPSAVALAAHKRKVLTTGAPTRTQLAISVDGEDRHFELKISPADQGGLLVAAVDVTQQRRQQEHLQVLLRELAHRAKNLLSLVDGIARQTAKAEGLPDSFVARFGARLAALGAAHDLLVSHDWKGVDIRSLVEGQLAHILPEARERISIEGPSLVVSPEAGQYLALALHELATNATKYGALGRPGGTVQVRWRVHKEQGIDVVDVDWVERGAPAEAPEHSGFGRLLLEKLVPRAVRGSSALDFGDQGLTWRLSFGG